LEAAVDTVRHQTLFQDMRIAVEVEPTQGTVHMEEDKLHQVVVNLLLNAAAASPGGAVWLRVRPVSGDWVELRCVDDGPGFDAVALDRAFEPFFTTKEVGEGTGLGLATCERVITGLGGSIEALNLTEGGACVQIRLPSSSA
jgi:signal transduction histidine kinase